MPWRALSFVSGFVVVLLMVFTGATVSHYLMDRAAVLSSRGGIQAEPTPVTPAE